VVLQDHARARLADRLGLAIHAKHRVQGALPPLLRGHLRDLVQQVVQPHAAVVECEVTGDHRARRAHRQRGSDDGSGHGDHGHTANLLEAGTVERPHAHARAVHHLSRVAHEVDARRIVTPERQSVQGQRGVMAERVARPRVCHGRRGESKAPVGVGSEHGRLVHVGRTPDANDLTGAFGAAQRRCVDAAGRGLRRREHTTLLVRQALYA
jgi:hypothetical protein